MHELAISDTICKIIKDEAQKRNMSSVKKAVLRIGVMNAFQRENLEVALKSYKDDAVMSDIAFDIEKVPVELKCKKCETKFKDNRFDDFDFAHRVAHAPAFYSSEPCPKCGSEEIEIISGNELTLVSIS